MVGIEPTIFRFEVGRLIHLATTALYYPVIVNIQYMFPNVSEIQSKQYEPWIPMIHDLPFASVVQ